MRNRKLKIILNKITKHKAGKNGSFTRNNLIKK